MPIRRYLGSEAFDAETTSKMSRAFLRAVDTLGISSNEAKREAVARFIVQLAKWNTSLDEEFMYSEAVATERGRSRVQRPLNVTRPDSTSV